MKRLMFLFLICGMCSIHASKTIEEVYSNIEKAALEYGEDQESSLFLYQYLQNELTEVDLDSLKKDPEILYYKVLAGFESAFLIENIQEFKDRMTSLKNDLRFIMDYAPYNSRLYAAGQLRFELVSNFIGISELSEEQLINAFYQFVDMNLRKFIDDLELSGRELREKVLEKLNESEELQKAFLDFVMLCDEDIDIVQNRYAIEKFQLLGIQEDEDFGVGLSIQFVLSNQNSIHTIEVIL